MTGIRGFRSGDEAAVADVCVRTADAGEDATGVLGDDALWADLFVLPYVTRHPEFAFVATAEDGRVVGYVVAAPDTRAFEAWFRAQWWPRVSAGRPQPTSARTREDGLLAYAYARGTQHLPYADAYPAHLHIDLLPEAQGRGWGRRLLETQFDALRAAGVPGVHLVAAADNTRALDFYRHLGLAELPSPPGEQAFALRL